MSKTNVAILAEKFEEHIKFFNEHRDIEIEYLLECGTNAIREKRRQVKRPKVKIDLLDIDLSILKTFHAYFRGEVLETICYGAGLTNSKEEISEEMLDIYEQFKKDIDIPFVFATNDAKRQPIVKKQVIDMMDKQSELAVGHADAINKFIEIGDLLLERFDMEIESISSPSLEHYLKTHWKPEDSARILKSEIFHKEDLKSYEEIDDDLGKRGLLAPIPSKQ